MTSRSEAPKARRTQQERRDETQRILLEATLACLVELGYARTTTTEIVRMAGLSQGALFKHYMSKAELLSAAIEHLFDQLVAGYQESFSRLPKGVATVDTAFELLWGMFKGPRLAVAFELYTAARTDADLQRALTPVVQRHRRELVTIARELFPQAATEVPEFDAWVDLLMCSMEGLVVEGYAAGNVGAPALAVLKQLMLSALTRGAPTHAQGRSEPSGARAESRSAPSGAPAEKGDAPWTP